MTLSGLPVRGIYRGMVERRLDRHRPHVFTSSILPRPGRDDAGMWRHPLGSTSIGLIFPGWTPVSGGFGCRRNTETWRDSILSGCRASVFGLEDMTVYFGPLAPCAVGGLRRHSREIVASPSSRYETAGALAGVDADQFGFMVGVAPSSKLRNSGTTTFSSPASPLDDTQVLPTPRNDRLLEDRLVFDYARQPPPPGDDHCFAYRPSRRPCLLPSVERIQFLLDPLCACTWANHHHRRRCRVSVPAI